MKTTKYGATSSLLILDYDVKTKKFMVMKRLEVPRSEYSFDVAVKTIIEWNEIYNPSWIFVDAGSGEYQIEKLHIYGEEHPETMLKNKVKRWQFKQSIDVEDPITREVTKTPMKPFMVTQLQIAFDRNAMILSPYDETLHKQLIDYEVVKIQNNGDPVFTSVNEHSVDALGLAFLAFVLEFPKLTDIMKKSEPESFKMTTAQKKIGEARYKNLWNQISNQFVAQKTTKIDDSDDLPGDRQTLFETPITSLRSLRRSSGWGSRMSNGRNNNRSLW